MELLLLNGYESKKNLKTLEMLKREKNLKK